MAKRVAKKRAPARKAEFVCDWGTRSHVDSRSYTSPSGAKGRAESILEEDATRASKFSTEDYDGIREAQMKIRGSDITEEERIFEVTIDSHYQMVRVIRLYKRQREEK